MTTMTEADLIREGFTDTAITLLCAYRQRADAGNVDEWLDARTIQRLMFLKWRLAHKADREGSA